MCKPWAEKLITKGEDAEVAGFCCSVRFFLMVGETFLVTEDLAEAPGTKMFGNRVIPAIGVRGGTPAVEVWGESFLAIGVDEGSFLAIGTSGGSCKHEIV